MPMMKAAVACLRCLRFEKSISAGSHTISSRPDAGMSSKLKRKQRGVPRARQSQRACTGSADWRLLVSGRALMARNGEKSWTRLRRAHSAVHCW